MISTSPGTAIPADSVNHSPHQRAPEKETLRLEAFSDGVFAIAITLLALELKVPSLGAAATPKLLWAALAAQWPSYFSFFTSFITVLIMWVNHHGIFRLLHRADAGVLFANGFLLLLVTVTPFPTALVAMYLRTPAASTACMVYAGLFVIISVAYALLLVAARRCEGRLLPPESVAEIQRRLRDCSVVGTPMYLLATIAAPIAPWITLAICTGMWVFWCIRGRGGDSPFAR